MDCCLLTHEEVGQLRHYEILPNHDNHYHLTTKKALELVKSGALDIVDGPDGRYYVTVPRMYFLKPIKSDGVIEIIQRVICNQPLHISPA